MNGDFVVMVTTEGNVCLRTWIADERKWCQTIFSPYQTWMLTQALLQAHSDATETKRLFLQ